MALEAEGLVALRQHALIDGTVGLVAARAAVANRLVLEYKRPALFGMALEAGLVFAHELGAAPFYCSAFVRVVAVAASHFALCQRVMMREAELRAHFEVALEAGFRGFVGIDDRACRSAALGVFAARPMAGFAADVHSVFPFRLQPRMGGGLEVPGNRFVTLFAGVAPHKRCSGDAGRRHDRPRERAARDHQESQRQTACGKEGCFLGSGMKPTS